jgi:RNA recognition motif-containing protein
MSSPEKRAREDKRDQKQREKERRRFEKRHTPPREPELTTASEIVGNVRSIDDVVRSLLSGGESSGSRSAAPLPSKLFVGSLSDATTSAGLRAHFAPHAELAESVVITDRATGASRNFGFVTLVDRKDAAAVIAALHHSELDGSRIVVTVATERR